MSTITKSRRTFTQSTYRRPPSYLQCTTLVIKTEKSTTFTEKTGRSLLSSTKSYRTLKNQSKEHVAFQEPHFIKISLTNKISTRNPEKHTQEKKDHQKYETVRINRQGPQFTVFEGIDKGTGKKVSIKKVVSQRQKLNKEFNIIKNLSHPNINKLLDSYFSSDRDLCYINIVSEPCPPPVHFHLKHRSISRPHLPLYLFQLLSALDYLHKLNIIHRNVGVHSVFIETRTHRLLLGDFELAKRLQFDRRNSFQVGHRIYRAPEMLFGTTEYDFQVDVWAFGCLVVEMLTGSPLFRGKSNTQQILQIVKKLGTPSQTQMAAMNPHYSLEEYRTIPKLSQIPLKDLINTRDNLILDLLTQIFVYEPQKRLSVAQAKLHPYFATLKDKRYLEEQLNVEANFLEYIESEQYSETNLSGSKSNQKQRFSREIPITASSKYNSDRLNSLGPQSIRLNRRLF